MQLAKIDMPTLMFCYQCYSQALIEEATLVSSPRTPQLFAKAGGSLSHQPVLRF
jgi:hypothetical protein